MRLNHASTSHSRHHVTLACVMLVILLVLTPALTAASQRATPSSSPFATPEEATPFATPLGATPVTEAIVATPQGVTPVVSPIAGASDVPVLAYYSLRLNPDSWDRAKVDFPLLGRYSSDDEDIMRQHVRWAKDAGIDGFIVSWRNIDTLTERLNTLIEISRQEDFKLVILYLSINAQRERVPAPRVASDLDYFAQHFADDPVFDLFGKPVIVWYGSWEFSLEEIGLVTSLRRDRLSILASERNPDDYRNRAELFDGNAYYWSSVDPGTYERYEEKLQSMADAVHSREGIWIAPAAPGFDARLAGGDRTVDRGNGSMLRTQLDAAFGSTPDAVGVISWNEFSENTHIEPSCVYGTQALSVLASVLGGSGPHPIPCGSSALAVNAQNDLVVEPDASALSVEEAESTIAIAEASLDEDEPASNNQTVAPAPKATAGAPTLRMATLSLLIVFGGFVGGCTMVIVVRTKRAQAMGANGVEERHTA